MPKIRNGDLDSSAVGVAYLCSRPCAPFLSLKLRRIRRELLHAMEDQESLRQEYLDRYAEKDKDGARVTEPKIVDGKQIKGPGGELVRGVVFADRDGFAEAMTELGDTEIEITEFISVDDLYDERHPAGFTVSADELDSLGTLFLDPAEAPARKPRKSRGSGNPKDKKKTNTEE